jgi:hypothetical protein
MVTKPDHSAPGQAAGYLYQFERALRHLAFSSTGAVVGIETLDDVVVNETTGAVVYEQDKHTISGTNPLADRSKGLWKSLRIWTEGIASGDIDLERAHFLLVTNQTISDGLASSLITPLDVRDHAWEQQIVDDLKRTGKRPSADLKEFVEGVLTQSDEDLTALLRKVLVVDGRTGGSGPQLVQDLTEKLHLDALHASNIVQGLIGWLHEVVMEAWRSGRQALIHRESFSTQLRFWQIKFQSQQLFRETAAALVPVKDEDRKAHRNDLFVRQLLWVGIDESDEQLLDAIDDFLKSATERTRLATKGNIPPEEFRAFDERLVKRWKVIFGARARSVGGLSDAEIETLGREILGQILEHREPLAGQQTQEFYLTTGAYHQLANAPKESPKVGWHPKYKQLCQPVETTHEASH